MDVARWFLLVSASMMRTDAVAPPCGPVDCAELMCWGVTRSVVQRVFAPASLRLNCDFTTKGGGWTILQQRRDQSIEFYRKWAEYKNGFDNGGDTFWLGLDHAHRLTKGRAATLRVELTYGRYLHTDHAEYDGFTLGNETTSYALNYTVFDRRSSLSDGLSNHSGPFCSWDSPYSEWCRRKAMYARTGWWFSSHGVINSDLNAKFRRAIQQQRLYWRGVGGVVSTQIKFRPATFGVVAATCSKSCPNGGTCFLANATFQCRCAPGYTGRSCETSLVAILPCFCFNGGSCLSDNTCACRAGYTGANCERKIVSGTSGDKTPVDGYPADMKE